MARGEKTKLLWADPEYRNRMILLKIGNKNHLGKKHSVETRNKISNNNPRFWLGKKLPAETVFKMSLARKGKPYPCQAGEKHYNWKGGITKINEKIRKSLEFKKWREAVFARDNWTCQECKQMGGELHADHIKPFAYFQKFRFAIDNGRTLCINCHRKTDTWGYRAIRYHENVKQLELLK